MTTQAGYAQGECEIAAPDRPRGDIAGSISTPGGGDDIGRHLAARDR